MDVNAFIQAAELDDVLIQVILTKPRRSLGDFIRRVAASSHVVGESSDPPTSAVQMYSHYIEKELAGALKTADDDAKATFPIAAAIGRASIGAAVGLVTNLTLGAKTFIEGLQEDYSS